MISRIKNFQMHFFAFGILNDPMELAAEVLQELWSKNICAVISGTADWKKKKKLESLKERYSFFSSSL